MTHKPDDAAHDERLVTIEELMAANPGVKKSVARASWLRRRGRHRAAPLDRKRGLATRT